MAPGLLLLVLLAPAASAEAFATLDSVEVAVANARLSGTMAGVAWLANPQPGTPLAPSGTVDLPGFSLLAEHAVVTVYHVDRYGANDVAARPSTRWTLSNASAAGAAGDAKDARLVALPTGPDATLAVGSDFLRVHAAPTETREFPTRVTGGTASLMSTGMALMVERGDDGLVEVRGSFRLVVNGLDFVLDSNEGSRDLHTRTDVQIADVETPLGSYAASSTVHEAVLDLQGAVLRLPSSETYVNEAAASSEEGQWTFRGATGRVESPTGSQPVAGYVELDGSVNGLLRRSDQRVAATLSGSVGGVVVDGRFTALATAPSANPATLPLVVGGAVALGLLAAAHLGVGRWRFGRLDSAMDRADYRNALGLSRGFAGHPKLAQDAALAAAICLLALGKPEDARARLQARSEWTVRRRPMRDFLLARAQAALGLPDEATRHLASSLVAEPSLLPQAQADPFLADVLRGLRRRPAEEAYA